VIIVTGSLRVRPGALDEAMRLCQEHVARSRAEPGCISHAVHRDADDPLRLFFFEEWADRAALDAHFAVPASQVFVEAVTPLASEPPRLTIYEAERL
jgi:quinol monooxygenase YgiN